MTAPPPAPRPEPASQFVAGLGLLARGLAMWVRTPRIFLLGAVPALISAVLLAGALVALIVFAGDISSWISPFADDWSSDARSTARTLLAIALVGLGGLLGVLLFTALTLFIGDPFYEKISEHVEDRCGGVPDAVDVPLLSSLARSGADSLRLVGLGILFGVPLFFAGFIPLVGQTVVPVVAALVGGWLLTTELVGSSFQRRGLRLADRRRVLREHRPLALGFGVGVFVCFLIPLGAVIVMPAAVAGGTLLTRRVLGLPSGP